MAINRIRIVIAAVTAFGFSMVYNGLVHLVILAGPNKQTEHLRRADFSSKTWISLVTTLATSLLFVGIYAVFVKRQTVKTGVLFGLCFGLFVALIVDLNQYVLYPLPFSLVAGWFVFGVIEFTLLDLIVGLIIKAGRDNPLEPTA